MSFTRDWELIKIKEPSKISSSERYSWGSPSVLDFLKAINDFNVSMHWRAINNFIVKIFKSITSIPGIFSDRNKFSDDKLLLAQGLLILISSKHLFWSVLTVSLILVAAYAGIGTMIDRFSNWSYFQFCLYPPPPPVPFFTSLLLLLLFFLYIMIFNYFLSFI